MYKYRPDVLVELFVDIKNGLGASGFQLKEIRCASTNDPRLCGAINDVSKLSRIKVLSINSDTFTGWLTIRIVKGSECIYPNARIDYKIEARTEQGIDCRDMKAFDDFMLVLPKKYERKGENVFIPFEHQ